MSERVVFALVCNHSGYSTTWGVFERREDAEAVAANPAAREFHDYGHQPEVEEFSLYGIGTRPAPKEIAPHLFQGTQA